MESVLTPSGNAAEAAPPEPDPPSSRLRWVILAVSGALLSLLLVSGALAIHFLREMHAQQQTVTHALSERTQMLAGVWLSVQKYNEAVRQFVSESNQARDRAARRHLDELTLQIVSDFKRYPDDRDTTEAALLDEMQNVFTQQRTLYISVLRADTRRARAPGGDRALPPPGVAATADSGLVRKTPGVERRAAPACRPGAGDPIREPAAGPVAGAGDRLRKRLPAGAGQHGLHRAAGTADPSPLCSTCAKPARIAAAFGAPAGRPGDGAAVHLARTAR